MSRNVYTIYLFTIIYGYVSGISFSCITRINTSNPKLESFCMFEEERSFTIGATLGLITSQIVYDYNPKLYVIGLFVIGVLGFILNLNMQNITIEEDEMESICDSKEIKKDEKKNIIIITVLYGLLCGLWCMGISGLEEVTPLLTTKSGYLSAIYTIVELVALFIINGKVIERIKKKNKLFLWETIVALLDILYLLLAVEFKSITCLILVYAVSGISATLGDPLWGCIISKFSINDRKNMY